MVKLFDDSEHFKAANAVLREGGQMPAVKLFGKTWAVPYWETDFLSGELSLTLRPAIEVEQVDKSTGDATLELEGLKFTARSDRLVLQGPDHSRLPYGVTWAAAKRLSDWLSVQLGKRDEWVPTFHHTTGAVDALNADAAGRRFFTVPDDLSPEALTAAVWNGEGLPPVGCVCEVEPHNVYWGFTSHQPRPCQVLAIDSDFVWLKLLGDPSPPVSTRLDKVDFRPLRTAEQLAAEAREKAVDEMVERFTLGDRDGVPWRDLFDQMYVAGYRKPDA